jgi:hypothetical protein
MIAPHKNNMPANKRQAWTTKFRSRKGNTMGVDTKVLLTSAPDVIELLRFASAVWDNARLTTFGGVNAFWLSFEDGSDKRALAVFPPGECQEDYADVCKSPAVYISMGCWGNSEAIARRFAVKFGGMIMPDDSKDDWQNV